MARLSQSDRRAQPAAIHLPELDPDLLTLVGNSNYAELTIETVLDTAAGFPLAASSDQGFIRSIFGLSVPFMQKAVSSTGNLISETNHFS